MWPKMSRDRKLGAMSQNHFVTTVPISTPSRSYRAEPIYMAPA